jgi:hypothetical protein
VFENHCKSLQQYLHTPGTAMATIYFGNSTDSHHLSVLLIGLPEAIGNRSQQKFAFLFIQVLGKALSLFYVSFIFDLRSTDLFQPLVLNLMNINVFVFVGLCNSVL